MSMICFFPWLRLRRSVDCGAFHLVEYLRGERPGGQLQAVSDAVLGRYFTTTGEPIQSATLLKLRNRGLTDELAEDEQAEVFEYAELLAFAGLARREYFRHSGYTNRDTFAVVMQRFVDPTAGVSIPARRRDGRSLNFLTADAFRGTQPNHVHVERNAEWDVPLLDALLSARGQTDWEELLEAVYFFGRANTDSDQIIEITEGTYAVSAFERLLGSGHSENALAQAILRSWRKSRSALPQRSARIPANQVGRMCLTELWIRDFYRHRNAGSHGRRETDHPKIWELREHLLFSAYAFPLMVRLLLADRGHYAITESDQEAIDAFELLLGVRPFEQVEGGARGDFEWTRVLDEVRRERRLEHAMRRFTELQAVQDASGEQQGL